MTLIPGIKQISQVGNDMYIQGAFPVSIVNTDVSYLADPADTRLLAGRDPVIEEVSVGMSGTETGIKTASGAAPLHITDAMQGMLRFLETNIKPVQDLHGYANPWPGGGGKNLYNPETSQNGINWNGNPLSYSLCSDFIPVTASSQYEFSITDTPKYNTLLVAFFDADQVYLTSGAVSVDAYTINTTASTAYIKLSIRCANDQTWSNDDIAAMRVQIEAGNTPTSWAPYANICPITGWTGCNVYVSPTTNQADATVYPCTWQDAAGTVFGGYADVVSGNGIIEYAEVDMGDLTWYYVAPSSAYPHGIFYTLIDDKLRENVKHYCTCYKYVAQADGDKDFISSGSSTTQVYVVDSRYSDPSDLKTALAGEKIVYRISIPTPFTFPGNQILTQDGTNYIWTDCGDTISAAYVAVK